MTMPFSNISTGKMIVFLSLVGGMVGSLPAQQWQSSLVHFDNLGKLVYVSDAEGNRIPDFSHAGYKGGGVALPDVPVVATVSPVAGDNTTNIQNAVNQAGAMALDGNGIRGAVLLNPGVYRVAGTIHVNFSGVVLRGSGQGADSTANTIIIGTGNTPVERDIIVAGGGSDTKWSGKVSGTQTNVTDDTVYVGANTFHVEDASAYHVGDNIVLYHPCTDAWLQAVEYGGTNGNTTEQWVVGEQPLVFNRYITAINGNLISVDVPVFNTLVKSLSQSYIYKYNRSGLKTNVGVENLRVDFTGWEPDTLAQESSAWTAIAISQVENGWVKNCTATHFVYACIRTETATFITIDSCNGLNPIGIVDGSDPNHRRYTFALDDASQQVLMQNCFATNGRHSFMSNGTSWTSGCVFYNVKVYNPFAPSEPHRRWSMGILYDNFKQLNGPLHGYSSELLGFYNRGDMGTGHGWAAAHCVAWNCDMAGGDLLVQKPPTAQNYAIGCFGNKITGACPPAPFVKTQGYIEGKGVANLNPPSLYMAQLNERLGSNVSLTSGNWSVPATWSNGIVPAETDDIVIPAGDTVTVDFADAQCRNLTLNGAVLFSNTVNGTGLTVHGSIEIESSGALKTTAQAAAGTALVHTLTMYGDLYNNGGTLDLRAGSGTTVSSNTISAVNVIFTGSANSTITVGANSSSNNEFNAITFNKSGGARIILQSDVNTNTSSTVAGAFITFTGGIVETNNFTLISLATSSGAIAGGSASSYVIGNLGRARSSSPGSLVYPIGDEAGYRPLTVYTSTSGLTTKHYLTASVIHGNANTGSSSTAGGIGAVSAVRYYKVTYHQSASTSPSMTFSKFAPSYGEDDNVTPGMQNLRVACSSDERATWTGHGPTGHTISLDSPPTSIMSDSLTTDQITLADNQSLYSCIAYAGTPSPEAPVLVSPANGDTVRATATELKWLSGPPEVIRYCVEYGTDSSFGNPTVDSSLTDTVKSLTQMHDGQTYWWRVRAKNSSAWGPFSPAWKFTCLISTPVSRGMNAGWNLISLPVYAADNRKSTLFPNAVSSAFAYNNGYVTTDSMMVGAGYWLKYDSARTDTLLGLPAVQESVAVRKGWNLVGSLAAPLDVLSVTFPAGNIISPWFAYSNSYIDAPVLQPFTGYWVKVDTAGVLILKNP